MPQVSDPNGAPYAPGFETLLTAWGPVDATEKGFEDGVQIGQAKAVAADMALDAFSTKVKVAITKGKKVDLSDPTYVLYYGSLAPNIFDRPVLSTQLALMLSWPALLAQSLVPELQALAGPAAIPIAAGVAAEKARTDAKDARKNFRLGGERKKIFDQYNAMVATVHGALTALVHTQPALGLLKGYAESFFRSGPVAMNTAPTNSTEAGVEVATLKKDLGAMEKIQADFLAAETAHASAEEKANLAITNAQVKKKLADEAAVEADLALEAAKKLKPKK